MATSGEKPSVTTTPAIPAAANVLDGFNTTNATQAATTLITVPAGRTWVGTVTINCTAFANAASAVGATGTGIISTAGAGVTPVAGNYLRCDASVGGNAAGGTVGDGDANNTTSPMVVAAPAGNSVTIQIASTVAGAAGQVSASAIGLLQ